MPRIKVAPKEDRTWNNIVFDSKWEMQQYINFTLLEKQGIIRDLKRQVVFPLHAIRNHTGERIQISKYIADWTCIDESGMLRVYDAKGWRTAEYKRSKKWFEWEYWPLYIVEL